MDNKIKVILPRTDYDINNSKDPIFFFAGPISGGGDWQKKCFYELKKHLSAFVAVIPCKYNLTHEIFIYRVSGEEDNYSRQTLWERNYLEIIANKKNGCVIFWLPCESKDNPRNDGNPYARDTYGELGEWRGRMINNPNLHITIGAESGFLGLSQISANFNDALKKDFPIYTSISDTVLSAIRKAS